VLDPVDDGVAVGGAEDDDAENVAVEDGTKDNDMEDGTENSIVEDVKEGISCGGLGPANDLADEDCEEASGGGTEGVANGAVEGAGRGTGWDDTAEMPGCGCGCGELPPPRHVA
jgi:hypothetical protein